jgi:acyl dehydratase
VASVTAARRVPLSYFEDVEVGVGFTTPGMTITDTHLRLFSLAWGDPQGEPGRAPDLLPFCLSSGLAFRLNQPPLAVLAFMGFEWRRVLPVHVGDTVSGRARTLVKRGMKEGGVVLEEREILNQHGEIVEVCKITLLVARRPTS